MHDYQVSPTALADAAVDIEALRERISSLQQAADKAAGLISSPWEWGIYRFWVHDKCMESIEAFRGHLKTMEKECAGEVDQLHDAAHDYRSRDDLVAADLLGAVGQETAARQEELRPLNPASQFYLEHRTWHGTLTSLPFPLGKIASTGFDIWRLTGDIERGDTYAIITDAVMIADDLVASGLSTKAAIAAVKTDPLGYVMVAGTFFLSHFAYWAKDIANSVTGDPMSTGQAAYSFDSIAQGCRELAEDFTRALRRLNGNWGGEAGRAAADRLRTFGDGVAQTANCASSIAAILQLCSSVMTVVEGTIKLIISDFVTWFAMAWLTTRLLAARTGGASYAVHSAMALRKFAHTSGLVASALKTARLFLMRIGALWDRAMKALADSKVGQKYVADTGRGGRMFPEIKKDVPKHRDHLTKRKHRPFAKHRALYSFDLRDVWTTSVKNLAQRSLVNRLLTEYGLGRYAEGKDGNRYPNGKRKISPIRYRVTIGGVTREIENYFGVITISLRTLLPFGRALQYQLRASETESHATIEQKLDALNAA